MSVYVPDVRCEIGSLAPFREVNHITVDSSWKQLTDTATITMPRNLDFARNNVTFEAGLNDVIKKGDSVKLSGGYNGTRRNEFQGFVSRVSKDVPIRITCEDYMYLLKLDSQSFSLKAPTLKDIVNRLLTGDNLKSYQSLGHTFNVAVTDTEPLYDSFTVKSLTGAQVLDRITSELPFSAYFTIDPEGIDKPTLVVGYRPGFSNYVPGVTNLKPVLRFGENVPASGWRLEYQNPEDVKVKVRAISNLKTGKKIIVEVGDPSGELRTSNYGPLSESQLKEFAEDELQYFKRDGFKGSVIAFGDPYIRHGDVVKVDDPIYIKESGNYFVDRTVWEFSEKPYIRRRVEIGLKSV